MNSKMSGWNHRVMAHQYEDEIQFEIHEVYYNKHGVPESYTENAISVYGESIEDIKWVLQKMNECLEKPILWADERWPEEYYDDAKGIGVSLVEQLKNRVNLIRKNSAEQTEKLENHLRLIDEAFDTIDKGEKLSEDQLSEKLKNIEDQISKL